MKMINKQLEDQTWKNTITIMVNQIERQGVYLKKRRSIPIEQTHNKEYTVPILYNDEKDKVEK